MVPALVAQINRRSLSCTLLSTSVPRFTGRSPPRAGCGSDAAERHIRPSASQHGRDASPVCRQSTRRHAAQRTQNGPISAASQPMTTGATSVLDALDALLESHVDRSKMARFRDVAEKVDHLLRAGVKRPAVLRTLTAHGLELTPAQFKSYLARWRSEQGHADQGGGPRPSAPAATPSSTTAASAQEVSAAGPGSQTAPVSDTPRPTANAARSIREIRNAEVDFAAADQWYRDRQRQRRAERQASRANARQVPDDPPT